MSKNSTFKSSLPETLFLSRLRTRTYSHPRSILNGPSESDHHQGHERKSPNPSTVVRRLSILLDISDRISSRDYVSERTKGQKIEQDKPSLVALPGLM